MSNRITLVVLTAALLAGGGCGSSTAKIDTDAHEHAGSASKPAGEKYHCPMHPTYISDRPGSCPICGMDLVPIEGGGAAGDAPTVAGRTTVFIPPERREQIGVVSTPVEEKDLARTIAVSATLEFPETAKVQVSPRIGGWIRELFIPSVGVRVAKDDPLFTLYSPELLSTQREYLAAKATGDDALIAAARRRLELWDIGDAQIAAMEASGEPSDTLLVRSPAAGIVTEKVALPGMAFMPGEMLFEIADVSTMWIHAFVAEQDLPSIATGQVVNVAVAAYPNRLYTATVDLVYPSVDEITRRAEVRLSVDNSDRELRGDMWATAEFEIPLGRSLVVPSSAIIDTGKRFVAFVDRDDGHLEPRDVKIGSRSEDETQVRKGLAAGERVVTRALFLVDSESQLKAAIAGLSTGDGK